MSNKTLVFYTNFYKAGPRSYQSAVLVSKVNNIIKFYSSTSKFIVSVAELKEKAI